MVTDMVMGPRSGRVVLTNGTVGAEWDDVIVA